MNLTNQPLSPNMIFSITWRWRLRSIHSLSQIKQVNTSRSENNKSNFDIFFQSISRILRTVLSQYVWLNKSLSIPFNYIKIWYDIHELQSLVKMKVSESLSNPVVTNSRRCRLDINGMSSYLFIKEDDIWECFHRPPPLHQ